MDSLTLRLDVCIGVPNWISYSPTTNSSVWHANGNSGLKSIQYSDEISPTRRGLPRYGAQPLRFGLYSCLPQKKTFRGPSFLPRSTEAATPHPQQREEAATAAAAPRKHPMAALLLTPAGIPPPHALRRPFSSSPRHLLCHSMNRGPPHLLCPWLPRPGSPHPQLLLLLFPCSDVRPTGPLLPVPPVPHLPLHGQPPVARSPCLPSVLPLPGSSLGHFLQTLLYSF